MIGHLLWSSSNHYAGQVDEQLLVVCAEEGRVEIWHGNQLLINVVLKFQALGA